MIEELNPGHPVTSGLHNHWHKIVALLMHKHGIQEFAISEKDIAGLAATGKMPTVLAHGRADDLLIKLFASEQEAIAYMAEKQGRV